MGDDCEDFGSVLRHDEHAGYDRTYESDAPIRSLTHTGNGRALPHTYPTKYEDVTNAQEQPYAQLIYRALMEVPGHGMILREIYEWFERNTDKAADKNATGWQNSIRHNLSMNGGFEKVE
ncbi:winged helix DNA-binding domain-containing protein, partial [Periconia macrospinosa]